MASCSREAGRRGGKKALTRPCHPRQSISVAFEKQAKGRLCPVCKNNVSHASYRTHMEECQLREDDSDVEVLEVLSASESRLRRAGPMIVLDDDMKEEESEENEKEGNEVEEQDQRGVEEFDRISIVSMVNSESTDMVETQPIPSKECDVPMPVVRRRSQRIAGIMIKEELVMENPPKATGKVSKRLREKMPVTNNNVSKENDHVSAPIRMGLRTSSSPLLALSPQKRRRTIDMVSVENKQEMPTFENVKTALEGLLAADKSSGPTDGSTLSAEENNKTDHVQEESAPYFVRYVLHMIKRVFSCPRPDGRVHDEWFWGRNLIFIDKFVQLSPLARLLYMRMFLKKNQWITRDRLVQRYGEVCPNIEALLTELVTAGFLQSDEKLDSLDVCLKLLPLPATRNVAKIFQLDITKSKQELTTSLLLFSQQNRSVFQTSSNSLARKMLKTVKQHLGPCYYVTSQPSLVLKAILTLCSPLDTNSIILAEQPHIQIYQNLLFTMLTNNTSKLSFPAPSTSEGLQICDIWETADELIGYVEAKELETDILHLTSQGNFATVVERGMHARKELEKDGPVLSRWSSLLPYVRRFTRPWVLVRCVSHTVSVLEKQKNHVLAVNWHRFLLRTPHLEMFCMDSRGEWWDRMTLNLSAHLKEKDESLTEIEAGMADTAVADKHRLTLQDRGVRLAKNAFPKTILLTEPIIKLIDCEVLSKNLGDARVNRFVIRDDAEGFEECRVEEVVRRYYVKNEGFDRGIHAEGSMWHTLFGLIFYDVIFSHDVPGVWLSDIQISPLDLNYGLYERRKTAMDERFEWLETADEQKIKERIEPIWLNHEGEKNSEIVWDLFQSIDDCIGFVRACPRAALVKVLRRMAEDYRNCRSGFPDLIMWNTILNTVAVVEVKGPGDRLSTKQRLWLHHFSMWGIRAECCQVAAANEVRRD